MGEQCSLVPRLVPRSDDGGTAACVSEEFVAGDGEECGEVWWRQGVAVYGWCGV
jgi:hypothetical protein